MVVTPRSTQRRAPLSVMPSGVNTISSSPMVTMARGIFTLSMRWKLKFAMNIMATKPNTAPKICFLK